MPLQTKRVISLSKQQSLGPTLYNTYNRIIYRVDSKQRRQGLLAAGSSTNSKVTVEKIPVAMYMRRYDRDSSAQISREAP